MNTDLRRRTVLASGAVGAGLATVTASGTSASARPWQVFRHGVASGDPLPDAVVLWTRVTPVPSATPGSGRGRAMTVTWEVARDAAFADVVRRGSFRTGPARDHTVKVDADGLEPDTWYHYRFLAAGQASPAGRTRTAPADDSSPDRFRVGVVSCSNWQAGHFAAYGHLAERDDLDAVLHLGDYLYENGPGSGSIRPHEPAHEMLSLADYRQRHGQYKTDPHLQALHARLPWIVTWDDHEVANDQWKDGAANHQPGEGDYLRRRARAHRAYDEWMPARMNGTADLGDGDRLYRRVRWGRLAEVSMLDLRSYRDEMVSTPAPFPLPQVQTETDDPDRTITGAEQLAWLKESLARDTAQWKLIGNPVMIAPLSMAQLPTATVEAIHAVTGERPADGYPFNTDQWDGYTDDRREVFEHIAAQGIKDAVFLTGDIHAAFAADLPLDSGTYPATGTAGVEFVCTSVTSDNLDEETGTEPRTATLAVEATLMANNRHLKYVNFDDHGYSVLDVTPERAQMDWWVLGDKRQRRTPASWDRSFLTVSGSGTVTQADAPVR